MTVFLLIIVALCLYKIKLPKPLLSGFNDNCLDITVTNSIKGIFILLVFLSHVNNYLLAYPEYLSSRLNSIYCNFQMQHLGQGIVIMFLLYSGYGVMESIKKKGTAYVNAIPCKRFLTTLINFDCAVFLFLILGLFLGTYKEWSIGQILLSFTGWTGIGNSNWYIFAVLMLYMITFVSFKIGKEKYNLSACFVTLFTFVYIVVMSRFKEAWWFDTVMCYPIGMWISINKERIFSFFKKNKVNYYAVTLSVMIAFVVLHIFRNKHILCYEAAILLLSVLVVLITMKIDINNPILQFLGKYLFEIYILMRLPMLVLLHFGITNTYLFVIISFVLTVLMALVFKKLLKFVDNGILKLCKIK